MPGIFISYRREDCPGHAGRIFDRLRSKFGTDVVFMDVVAIEAGVDFVDVLHKAVGSCDALLAVIGPQWVSASHGGKRRLDDPRDFVRLEIAGALERNVRVLPVLVEGASVPSTDDLPADLQALTRRQAVELRDGRWDDDIERLVEGLEKFLKAPASPQPQKAREEVLPSTAPVASVDPSIAKSAPGRGVAIGAVATLILLVAAVLVWRGGLGPESSGTVTDSTGQTVAPGQTATSEQKVVTPPVGQPAVPPASTPGVGSRESTASPPGSPNAAPPNVTGKTILEAREILRRAGFRFLIRFSGGRSKEPGIVLTQALDESTGSTQPRRVLLTAVPTSTVLVHVVKGDEQKADDLVAYLKDEPSTIGSIVRSQAVVPRAEGIGRVAYSEERLAAQAEAIAKDTSAYLARIGDRRTLQTAVNPRVAPGSIIVNLYERAQ
jgi:hypothetical protein